MKTNNYIIRVFTIATTLLFCGCGSYNNNVNNSKQIMVSIEPLKGLVDIITCNDFIINTIVPLGEGPETYAPTPSTIAKIEESEFVFLTGPLEFERELIGDNKQKNRNLHNISSGTDLISSEHAHHHAEEGHSHHHGTDPHIWLSVRELQTVVNNITDVIMAAYPDSTKYAERGVALIDKLKECDAAMTDAFAESGAQAFAIYHPALSYYARDYGLEQIAIEDEGKEPNLARLKSSIDRAKSLNINKILYQREYPVSVVENFATELGATPEMFDPLSSDIVAELCRITTLLTGIEVVVSDLNNKNLTE